MSFGKSSARMLSDQTEKITFDDVAGVDEAKEEVGEIVDFLKDPKKYTRLGGRIPKGVLMVGAPGTGKAALYPGQPALADDQPWPITGRFRTALEPISRRSF